MPNGRATPQWIILNFGLARAVSPNIQPTSGNAANDFKTLRRFMISPLESFDARTNCRLRSVL
jgi:hypothetical protein